VPLLGFRSFYHFSILKKSNVRRVFCRLALFMEKYALGEIEQTRILPSNSGWRGYAMMGDTYKLRQQVGGEIENILAQNNQLLSWLPGFHPPPRGQEGRLQSP
jgi:hypothetical protein